MMRTRPALTDRQEFPPRRRGYSAAIIVATTAALAAGTFGVLSTANLMSSGIVSQKPALPLASLELKGALARAGLDPEALAAAGVAPEGVTTLVGLARTYLVDHIQDLRDADSDFIVARQEVDRLERAVTGGASDQAAALATARGNLSAAAFSRQDVLDGTYAAATAGLTEGQVALLSRMKTGRAGRWGLPIEFLAATRSEPEQVALRNALANERISSQLGQDPDGADQQVLTLARADAAVAAAKSAVESSKDAVTAAWMAAAGQ
ncbi:MAG: hypothetical protein IT436_00045 [Phycisphaerales bacterium]|nr:hypothetical protein [Phycisphaerales bacterium]